jgi:hypothetical protein
VQVSSAAVCADQQDDTVHVHLLFNNQHDVLPTTLVHDWLVLKNKQ